MHSPYHLTTTDNNLGEELYVLQFIQDGGEDIPPIYYVNGIEDFDNIFVDGRFYEYKFTFTVASYTNGIIFYMKSDKPILVCIWRKDILHYDYELDQDITILNNNSLIDGYKNIPLIGPAIIGNVISKIRGIKSKSVKGIRINLYFQDKETSTKKIVLEAPNENAHLASAFFNSYWKSELSDKEKKPINTDGACYIATVCYSSVNSPELNTFRNFRDSYLLKSTLGKKIVSLYYKESPKMLKFIGKNNNINKAIRKFILDKIYRNLKQKGY